jgi:hypothetical protein
MLGTQLVLTPFQKDQGRRDDLWSMFYVLIELRMGILPWSHLVGPDDFVCYSAYRHLIIIGQNWRDEGSL